MLLISSLVPFPNPLCCLFVLHQGEEEGGEGQEAFKDPAQELQQCQEISKH